MSYLSNIENLTQQDFIDWGTKEQYVKAIGIGECAGVTIDLIQTLLFETEEAYGWALNSLSENRLNDAIYHAYNARIRAAKALLTAHDQKTNSHTTIINGFDDQFPHFKETNEISFKEGIQNFIQKNPDAHVAKNFIQATQSIIAWVKKERDAKQ